jgi:hypothetical protein
LVKFDLGGVAAHPLCDSNLDYQPTPNTLTLVELKEQPFIPTLAHKLGDVLRVSGLLRRIAQNSSAGERVAEWLLKVAIEIGRIIAGGTLTQPCALTASAE